MVNFLKNQWTENHQFAVILAQKFYRGGESFLTFNPAILFFNYVQYSQVNKHVNLF